MSSTEIVDGPTAATGSGWRLRAAITGVARDPIVAAALALLLAHFILAFAANLIIPYSPETMN